MGHVIDVYCNEPSHDGRESRVARLERMYAGTHDEHWAATRLGQQGEEGRSVSGPASKMIEGSAAHVSDERLWAHLFEGGELGEVRNTLDLQCDHPRCGFHWQRSEPACRPTLNVLADHGLTRVSLRALAARVG